eukprot:GEMP01128686.1.p2 GENE.GEMP01128686.1~~GEMP01128686.1.p2  ORF type:complete len:138 (-),score=8.50 GEMP01128686.1:22-435(-)
MYVFCLYPTLFDKQPALQNQAFFVGHALCFFTAHRTRIKTQYPATNHPFALNRYCYTRVLYERWAMSADNDPLQHEERILCTNCKQFSLYQECAHAYAAHCLRSGVAPATALVTSKSINTTFGFNGNQDSRVVIILH